MNHKVSLENVIADPEVSVTFCSFVSAIKHKAAQLSIVTNIITRAIRFEVKHSDRVSHKTAKFIDIKEAINFYNSL